MVQSKYNIITYGFNLTKYKDSKAWNCLHNEANIRVDLDVSKLKLKGRLGTFVIVGTACNAPYLVYNISFVYMSISY